MKLAYSLLGIFLSIIFLGMKIPPIEPPAAPTCPEKIYQVSAVAKTEEVSTQGDSADDTAIYINKENPEKSLIIGTNKNAGVIVYDLLGNKLQEFPDGEPNNIDIRYNFPFEGKKIPLIATGNREVNTIDFYTIGDDGLLARLNIRNFDAGLEVYGFCMYKSPLTSEYFVFVNSKKGEVIQWQVAEDENNIGSLILSQARFFKINSQVEGCVADEYYRRFYIGEEKVGIWQLGAEKDDTSEPILIDSTLPEGHLVADVEGLSLYRQPNGEGYLVASSQGENAFNLYKRDSMEYVGKFTVDYMAKKIQNTDGVEVSSHALSSLYPYGLIVVQDGNESNPFQSFKLVPWQNLAAKFEPVLNLQSYDPILDF